MKRTESIYSTCLALLSALCLLAGCANDEMPGGRKEAAAGKPLLTIATDVAGNVETRAKLPVQRNGDGSWIESMTVFLFAPGAGEDSTPLLVKSEQGRVAVSGVGQVKSIDLSGKELSEAGIELGTTVDIYAIANHIPDNAAQLTLKQVKELKAGSLPAYRMTGGVYPFVPMSGVLSGYTITSTVSQTATVELYRAVICVSLTLVDGEYENNSSDLYYQWGVLDMKLYNDYSDTYLWNSGIPANPGRRTEANALYLNFPKDDQAGEAGYPIETYNVGNFYLNTNEESPSNPASSPITIKIRGTRYNENGQDDYEHTIPLKRPDGTFDFKRNTHLDVRLTLKAKGYEANVTVVPWGLDTENPDINPAGVRFTGTEIATGEEMSTVIPQDGQLAAKFKFDNPAGIPFKLYLFEGEGHDGTPLKEYTPDDAAKELIDITSFDVNDTGKNRYCSFWYEYDGEWVDTDIRAMQRASTTVNVLFTGDFLQKQNGATPTSIGDAVPSSNWCDGFDYLLYFDNNPFTKQTGCSMKLWNLYNKEELGANYTSTKLISGKTMEIKEILEYLNIDVLALWETYKGSPTEAQSAAILEWLNDDPHRVVICAAPYFHYGSNPITGANGTFFTYLGLDGKNGDATTGITSVSGDALNGFAGQILRGPFADVSGQTFVASNSAYGVLYPTQADAAGFVPILKTNVGNYHMAVNPQQRIVFIADTEDATYINKNVTTALTPYGSYGPYGRLYANLWSWMVETVVMGRQHPNLPVQ